MCVLEVVVACEERNDASINPVLYMHCFAFFHWYAHDYFPFFCSIFYYILVTLIIAICVYAFFVMIFFSTITTQTVYNVYFSYGCDFCFYQGLLSLKMVLHVYVFKFSL